MRTLTTRPYLLLEQLSGAHHGGGVVSISFSPVTGPSIGSDVAILSGVDGLLCVRYRRQGWNYSCFGTSAVGQASGPSARPAHCFLQRLNLLQDCVQRLLCDPERELILVGMHGSEIYGSDASDGRSLRHRFSQALRFAKVSGALGSDTPCAPHPLRSSCRSHKLWDDDETITT